MAALPVALLAHGPSSPLAPVLAGALRSTTHPRRTQLCGGATPRQIWGSRLVGSDGASSSRPIARLRGPVQWPCNHPERRRPGARGRVRRGRPREPGRDPGRRNSRLEHLCIAVILIGWSRVDPIVSPAATGPRGGPCGRCGRSSGGGRAAECVTAHRHRSSGSGPTRSCRRGGCRW
jgi:hypothetical protein